MDIPVRKTLIGCKLTDIEERQNGGTLYFQNEHKAVFAINIEGKYSNINILDESEEVCTNQIEKMDRKEAVKQLKLIKSYEYNYKQLVEKDIEALDYAIKSLED